MSNKKIIAGIFIVSIFFTILGFIKNSKEQGIEDYILQRPNSEELDETVRLNVYKDQELATEVELIIKPRKKSVGELDSYFTDLYEEVLEDIKANNTSLEEVRSNLKLSTTSRDGKVQYDWFSENYSLINYEGTVHNEKFNLNDQAQVNLKLVMKYDEYSCEYLIPITVKAPNYSKNEWDNEIIARQIEDANKEYEYEDYIVLPDKVDNQEISYEIIEDKDSPWLFLGLGIIAIFVVIYGEKKKKNDKAKKRIRELTYDYSEVVSKLTLLLGAGMTTRKAWSKIVSDYMKKRKQGIIPQRLVYEEMYETECNMNSGISELSAYERFGKRCNTKEYIKLASLLQTNIKKGTKELVELLEKESFDAFEQRKHLARRKGEEATTKLLIPMIMMLAIVMVIIMVPAVMNFNV